MLRSKSPIVAASDYVTSYAAQIAPFIEAPFLALGTDGFGRSDTRAALRRFFEVDRHHIVVAALYSLAESGACDHLIVSSAIKRYELDSDVAAPWTR